MDTRDILSKVKAAGLRLVLRDGKLLVEGPRSAVTPLLGLIREHKVELLAELQTEHRDRAPAPAGPRQTRGQAGTGAQGEGSRSQPAQGPVQWFEEVAEFEARFDLVELPGSAFDHKPTTPGDVPPLERALARQRWLASIDLEEGLRCGISGHQCRVRKGTPCQGTCE